MRFSAKTARTEPPYLTDDQSKGIRLWPTNFGLIYGKWRHEELNESQALRSALKVLAPEEMEKLWSEETEEAIKEKARQEVRRYIERNDLGVDDEWRAYQALGLDQ